VAAGGKANVLIVGVSPGPQFHLVGISWRGNSAFSEAQLAGLFQCGQGLNVSQSCPCLYRQRETLRILLTKSTMHDWTLQISRHSYPRAGTTTHMGAGEHSRVFPGTTTAKESRGFVRRTEKSDRIAPPALTTHEVRPRAVLPGKRLRRTSSDWCGSSRRRQHLLWQPPVRKTIRALAASRLTAERSPDHGVFITHA
jgi:hypothetical protein